MIGTVCDYQIVVPGTSYESDAPWIARARNRGSRTLPTMLGDTAYVKITHISPGPGVLYSDVLMSAARPRPGRNWPLQFQVDRRLTSSLAAGDVVHICRTDCGGLGLSVLRNDELVAAAGAVCSVPLGRTVAARHPADLMDQAVAPLRRRDPGFEWHEWPIEVAIGDEVRLLTRNRIRFGGYEVFAVRGYRPDLPGTDECLAISQLAARLEVATNLTALLLDASRREPA